MARVRSVRRSETGRAARVCDTCGEPYYRCNVTRVWDGRNPGHRDGWHKAEQHTCNKCTSAATAKRMLVLATMPSRKVGAATESKAG